ncbi:manganese transporter [Jeotgalicoccus coquinae]|uniref:Divalent metal cation transporter MntH n=1 Tax=Jeotgalicoccus coquinae TaxID=709509 RepID=A0A6V7R0A5_9STAP|nr:Nramp family divalent metal transporter [Jeotgalicoccus coquinae]MBB6423768.1 Mn2+/Fe2+ NRAMP family transporter [Jeotgalicoccus coquinae]GGE22418.1 manganese transporter [Jeotgalicoccus coquinae]CAD2070761.1 Divalent metal cation transporter MntH [Jeotgalicoccus coquinae]
MNRFKEILKALGPGMVITASFIGPGTVTTMTRAGAGFGYSLLWAVLFSIIATIVLQEMIIRLALVTRRGLGEAIYDLFNNTLGKFLVVWISMLAVAIGCAAYMSGDLLGTSLGLGYLLGIPTNILAPIVGVIILTIGILGSYKVVEKIMLGLMVIMGVTFITTMFLVKPDWSEVFGGAVIPSIPDGSIIMVIALIGTTVVPYNFFLHATAVHERFDGLRDLALARWDTIISITIGGIISAAILISAGALIYGQEVDNVVALAGPLVPILGDVWAPIFISIGLFAAGFSSALASPMGAAATVSSFFKWEGGMKNTKFKMIFGLVILIGVITSAIGFEPLEVILLAQALNGVILPLIAILIYIIVNKKGLMGKHKNGPILNIVGFLVVAVVSFLGIYSMIDAVTAFFG